jgi:predicted DNA-binding protein (MmcQ/YjbR family)
MLTRVYNNYIISHRVEEEVVKMKKVVANIIIFFSVILMALVAIPWNNLSQWSINITLSNNYEFFFKAGIGGLLFLLSFIFLFVSNHEYKKFGAISKSTAYAAFVPLWLFSIGAIFYSLILSIFEYSFSNQTTASLIILGSISFFELNLVGFGHLLASGFRTRNNLPRILIYFFLLEIAVVSCGVGYYVFNQSTTDYATLRTYYYVLVLAIVYAFYFIHLILFALKRKSNQAKQHFKSKMDGANGSKASKLKKTKDFPSKKTFNQPSKKTQKISKKESKVSMAKSVDIGDKSFEDVIVDSEFIRTSSQATQVNAIDYYIEKQKMVKILDPTYDILVEYVKNLPNVVVRTKNEKITFYYENNPFLVLLNYGNSYRIAFKSEIEKGIRLIVKYPTISKNKSMKDGLWFKANNYGDLPKELIYRIVKSSYDYASN